MDMNMNIDNVIKLLSSSTNSLNIKTNFGSFLLHFNIQYLPLNYYVIVGNNNDISYISLFNILFNISNYCYIYHKKTDSIINILNKCINVSIQFNDNNLHTHRLYNFNYTLANNLYFFLNTFNTIDFNKLNTYLNYANSQIFRTLIFNEKKINKRKFKLLLQNLEKNSAYVVLSEINKSVITLICYNDKIYFLYAKNIEIKNRIILENDNLLTSSFFINLNDIDNLFEKIVNRLYNINNDIFVNVYKYSIINNYYKDISDNIKYLK